MFTDRVKIKLFAGKGGNGVVAWRREKFIPKGGPYGGNGGRGGSLYICADDSIPSLDKYRNNRQIRAENGSSGGSAKKQGKAGKDLILKVPCGTLIKDLEGNILHDLTQHGEKVLLCNGGKGGKGNDFFKTSTNQAPNRCTPGLEGECKDIELELKLIADVGFIGMPNAGKSTLLSKISDVDVKIASYPFTTLHPNLSYIQFEDFSRLLIADIPGIIKDAHSDRGLGLAFLRHIERTSTLIFVLDSSGIDGRNPIEDFETLKTELLSYSPQILDKPHLVALNKIDVKDSANHIAEFLSKYPNTAVCEISALNGHGMSSFIEAMREIAQAQFKHY